jgi:hypothetical protein
VKHGAIKENINTLRLSAKNKYNRHLQGYAHLQGYPHQAIVFQKQANRIFKVLFVTG